MNKYLQDFVQALENTRIEFMTSKVIETDEREVFYEEGIQPLIDLFKSFKKMHSKIYFVGNGGSAAISSHMTADYMKNGGMNTISLYDNAVTTCLGNDYGYEYVFSKPISFLASSRDVLVVISSSGNSRNLVNAIESMRERGGIVVTFTGFDENNTCRSLGDVNIYVPCHEYGKVESIHQFILQQIVDIIMGDDGRGF